MSFPDPSTISSEEGLRLFVFEALRLWIGEFDKGTIPVKIPKLRGQMRLLPGKPFHFCPELFLQLSGETVFEFPEEKIRVGPGEICLVPRGMPHFEKVRALGTGVGTGRRSSSQPFFNLVFFYPREVFFHLASERPRGKPSILIGSRMPEQIGSGIARLLDEAVMLAQTDGQSRAHGIKGLVLAHLSLLMAALEGWTAPPNPEPFRVAQARQSIMKHLPDPDLSISLLARQLHCSADYLSQLFRKSTGTPLHAYIIENRLQRARDLLESSNLNIAEVSEAAGFRDPGYFTRVFRRWAGVTPRAFRQALPRP